MHFVFLFSVCIAQLIKIILYSKMGSWKQNLNVLTLAYAQNAMHL